jgi:demethylmenaquinone methyltransferase/2-methoxy-6-polyprenyl-1,4-benzoquinol methylase
VTAPAASGLGRVAGTAAAYDATGERWEAGPGRVYNRLAEQVVACSPVMLRGRVVLDLGAGTGAASRALVAAGARPVAADAAHGMLAAGRAGRPPAVLGDALALPFGRATLGGVVAAFCLNHLTDPALALREAARVARPGAPVVASTYAADDSHPVKAAVEDALRAVGWRPVDWYESMKADAVPLLASVERCLEVAGRAGLDARCRAIRVPFPDLGADDLVAWRLGMPHHAPFVAGLDAATVERVIADALARLRPDHPTLVRSILVLTAVA